MSTPDTFTQLLQEEVTPRPDPEFAAEMDEWVADGFPPRGGREPRRRPSFAWLNRAVRVTRSPLGLAGAGGALAAVVIALVLVADSAERSASSDSGQSAAMPAPTTAEEPPIGRSEDWEGLSQGNSAPVPAPELRQGGGGVAPGERARKIERDATMTLASPADDFQSTADEILKVTDRHQGFVLQSNVTTGDRPSGDFQLRIPADRLQTALRDFAALGDVQTRSDTGRDVTKEYVSVTDSFAAARAERKALLRRLRAAGDADEIQRIRFRLDQNAQERARLRGQIRDLRERTDYAAVNVTLVEKEGGGDESDDGGAGFGGGSTNDALDDSLGLLVGSFNWLLRALGVLIPAGIVGGSAWWAARTLRRRRREAVLF